MSGQTPSRLERPAIAFLLVLAAFIVASALTLSAARRWEDRRRLATGPAQWIWLTFDIEEPMPLRFVAVRDFDWSGASNAAAPARVFVDRRYTLRLNGMPVGTGGQRVGDPLDVYEVSSLLRSGWNRIEIWAESPNGMGGILFLLRLPDGTAVATDRSWQVAKTERELSLFPRPPAVWGKPPMYPWGYPRLRPRDLK